MPFPDEAAIDRISPTRKPDRRAVMYQKWRSLLFLHWSFDPATIRPLVPKGLEIDTYDGRAYVGLVPFTMRGVRPVGLPAVPWLSNFHETNVRTYVHYEGRDPGVYFFSLDAANPVAVRLARWLFHLPYFTASMSLARSADGTIDYASRRLDRGCGLKVRWRPTGPPSEAQPGTLEHFLLERYLLYCGHRGRLFQGQVYHPPYPVQPAEVDRLEEDLLAAAGVVRPSEPPLMHYAEGVDPEIFSIKIARPR